MIRTLTTIALAVALLLVAMAAWATTTAPPITGTTFISVAKTAPTFTHVALTTHLAAVAPATTLACTVVTPVPQRTAAVATTEPTTASVRR